MASATAAKLADFAGSLPQGSTRRRVLECAGRFKTVWVELARLLVEVKRDELWREWGFPTFDAYCSKELFLRKQTAEKLTRSYGFLERHEPHIARLEAVESPAPSFEVIEVLSRAEAAGRLSEAGYREIRDDVLSETTPAAVNRQLSDRFGPAPRPEPREPSDRLRQLAGMARRVADGCRSCDAVPGAVAERAAALADDLRELLD